MKRLFPITLLTCVSVFIISLTNGQVIRSAQLLTPEPGKYEKAEWEIRLSANYLNPYDSADIALEMVLRAPSGKTIILPCYYEAGNTDQSIWKARFAPRETGRYNYSFRLINKQKVVTTKPAFFQAKPSGKDGFLHTGNLWTFRFDSGKPFRGIGENVAWEGRVHEDPKNSFEYFLPRLARGGGNFFRTISVAWNLPMEQQIVETKRRLNKRYSNTNAYYHPQGLARMDTLLNMADSLGLYCMLTLSWHGELRQIDHWSIYPYNTAQGGPAATPTEFFTHEEARRRFRNRLRYIIARWGYSTRLAMLELFNEIDNASYAVFKDAGGSSTDSIVIPHRYITEWHAAMGRYLRSIDPYQHIVSTSISHREIEGLFQQGEMDVNIEHIYKRTDAIPAAINHYTTEYKKPFVVGEYGFRWEDAKTIYTQESIIDYKKGLWYGLFNPTPVLPMTWWWEFFDQHQLMNYLTSVRAINDRMLRAGGGSFKQVSVTGSGLYTAGLQCGNTYFVHVLNKDSTDTKAMLSIPVGRHSNYQVKLFDPETGNYSKIPSVLKDKVVVIDETLFRTGTHSILIIEPK